MLLKLGRVLPAGQGVRSNEDSHCLCLDGLSSVSISVAVVTYFVGDRSQDMQTDKCIFINEIVLLQSQIYPFEFFTKFLNQKLSH